MYCEHFGLTEFPFALASNPRFLFLGKQHARMRAFIEYAARAQESLVVCTGEIGCGKTTLINEAIDRFPKQIETAAVRMTKMSDKEFMAALLVAFGSNANGADLNELRDRLYRLLIDHSQSGRRIILFVDEAQFATRSILEEVRSLADLENRRRQIVSIVLAGQPELNRLIDSPEMENFRQRIRLRLHLGTFDQSEIKHYIDHRLRVAGATTVDHFPEQLLPTIHKYTGGRPRMINQLCDFALTTAFVLGETFVSEQTLATSIEELQWDRFPTPATPQTTVAAEPWFERAAREANDDDAAPSRAEAVGLDASATRDETTVIETSATHAEAGQPNDTENGNAPEQRVEPPAPVAADVNFANQVDSRAAPESANTNAVELQTGLRNSSVISLNARVPKHEADDRELDSETIVMAPRVPKIVVRRGAEIVGTFPIDKKSLNIGRMPDNDIVVNDRFMSRYHAQVFTKNGVSHVRDLNSTNGVFVDKSRVALQELMHGTTFTIGDHRFTFESDRAGWTDPEATQTLPALARDSGSVPPWKNNAARQAKAKVFSLLRFFQR